MDMRAHGLGLTLRGSGAARDRFPAIVAAVLCAGAVLVQADRSEGVFREGAVFPSPHLAPVADPYLVFYYNSGAYFPPIRWRGWHVPEHMTVAKYSDVMTKAEAISQFGQRITSNFDIDADQRLWEGWVAAGVLPLLHVGDGEWGTQPGVKQLELTPANAPFGLSFDEFAGKHGEQRRAEFIDHFRAIKRRRPGFLVAAWIAPFEAITEQIADSGNAIDVLIPETYVGYVKTSPDRIEERIDEARSLGVLRKTILGLWVGQRGTPPEVVMPWTADRPAVEPDLDAQIATMRRLAPEMPGVALYMIHPGNVDWLAEYDAVIHKHFYAPAPSVAITQATLGGEGLQVCVMARPNPGTRSPVAKYRYFLDATCVRISDSPVATLATGDLAPGEHILTVHAVDETYLAGMDRVRFVVGKNGM